MEQIFNEYRKAKKQHTCFGCCGKIEEGEIYAYLFYADGGVAYNTKLCYLCEYAVSDLLSHGDTFCEGDIANEHEYVDKYRAKWFIQQEYSYQQSTRTVLRLAKKARKEIEKQAENKNHHKKFIVEDLLYDSINSAIPRNLHVEYEKKLVILLEDQIKFAKERIKQKEEETQ